MDSLIAQQKQAAVNERDELIAANQRQQERLVKSVITANSTETPVGTVQSLIIGTLSRSNSTKRDRLNTGFRNILEVEQALDDRRDDFSEAHAKLLYKLLSSWKKNPTPEIVAAVERLRGVLESTTV